MNTATHDSGLRIETDASAFLSDDDVARLTGYRQPKKIQDALRSMHIPFIVNVRGKTLVLRSDIQSSAASKPAKAKAKEWTAPV